jgi:hypothetical protein
MANSVAQRRPESGVGDTVEGTGRGYAVAFGDSAHVATRPPPTSDTGARMERWWVTVHVSAVHGEEDAEDAWSPASPPLPPTTPDTPPFSLTAQVA